MNRNDDFEINGNTKDNSTEEPEEMFAGLGNKVTIIGDGKEVTINLRESKQKGNKETGWPIWFTLKN